ncbi:hypothetical protein RQP46_010475 [Phenoliferia psychrophenolica]
MEDGEIGEDLVAALTKMPSLSSLVLGGLILTKNEDLASWAPTVRYLVIKNCFEGNRPFEDDPGHLSHPILHTLDYQVPDHFDAVGQASSVTEALVAPWPSGPDSKPVDLHITGLSNLFSPPSPADNLDTTTYIVRLLNWIGEGHLASLTLPLHHTFHVNDIFSNLTLPHLHTLSLVNAYPPLIPLVVDVLNPSSCANLFSLINHITSPSLKTLHLRGWLDHSSVLAIGVVAQSTPHRIAMASLPLAGLLHYLRGTTILELKLENSEGHADGDVQCIFKLGGSRRWRRAVYLYQGRTRRVGGEGREVLVRDVGKAPL